MKLFVDDIRNAPDETWLTARTIRAAINALDTFEFDLVSLDHDISHQIAMGTASRPYPCEETFAPVASYIGATSRARKIKPEIIIHTANPVGANILANICKRYDLQYQIKPYPAANRLETQI